MALTYEPIATTTLGSAASITFSSIPNTYTDLRVIFVGTASSTNTTKRIQFNSDTSTSGTNYSTTIIAGNGTSALSNRYLNEFGIRLASNQVADSLTIPVFIAVDIFSYNGSTFKSVLSMEASDQNGGGYVQSNVGLWRSTAAITSLTLMINADTFTAGTTATLYGIKAA